MSIFVQGASIGQHKSLHVVILYLLDMPLEASVAPESRADSEARFLFVPQDCPCLLVFVERMR